jgi:hypothetical protein
VNAFIIPFGIILNKKISGYQLGFNQVLDVAQAGFQRSGVGGGLR